MLLSITSFVSVDGGSASDARRVLSRRTVSTLVLNRLLAA